MLEMMACQNDFYVYVCISLFIFHDIKLSFLPRVSNGFFRVVLRGDRDDNAVLCTKDTTFELKVAETSNTMLLMPSLSDPTRAGKCLFSVCESMQYLGAIGTGCWRPGK